MAGGRRRILAMAILAAGLGARCGDVNAALEQRAEARRVSADLLIAFTRAADAANRAVMADTDELSIADAREAEVAKQRIDTDVDALRPLLQRLGYSDESRVLDTFTAQYTAYKDLDRRILDLAVENTNLKAQRLSFGQAQAAADEFRDAIEAAPGADAWRARALAEGALAAVREIHALQAPHIAEPQDASMTRLEQRMAAAETVARKALAELQPLVAPGARARVAAATAALDRFMGVNAQILALSRRNTNVRSLALSLDEKRKLTGPCDGTLRTLLAAIEKRTNTGGSHPGGR